MLNLQTYFDYFAQLHEIQDVIHSVRLVNNDNDMSDALRSMKRDELPALMVVVPSAEDRTTPDSVAEDNLCLLFLLDRADSQRRPSMQVLKDTQPVVEVLKAAMREYSNRPCHWMRGLSRMNTNPETGLYADFCGWSVSFHLLTCQ